MLMIVGFFRVIFQKIQPFRLIDAAAAVAAVAGTGALQALFRALTTEKIIILDAVRSRTCAHAQAYPRPLHAINDKTRKI